ncbi:MAG: hypothetical protein J3R72DRAFT_487576 [Linnemannia gamsii]|nr:MAG: hypothetical protein J3R72DRAFT_487576 [Linnemannia gamsii]
MHNNNSRLKVAQHFNSKASIRPTGFEAQEQPVGHLPGHHLLCARLHGLVYQKANTSTHRVILDLLSVSAMESLYIETGLSNTQCLGAIELVTRSSTTLQGSHLFAGLILPETTLPVLTTSSPLQGCPTLTTLKLVHTVFVGILALVVVDQGRDFLACSVKSIFQPNINTDRDTDGSTDSDTDTNTDAEADKCFTSVSCITRNNDQAETELDK